MKNTKPEKERSEFSKKLERLYENYGIDTSSMEDDEFERLGKAYISSGKNIDDDLKESEKYRGKFSDDIVG
jgi:hypothetical protein